MNLVIMQKKWLQILPMADHAARKQVGHNFMQQAGDCFTSYGKFRLWVDAVELIYWFDYSPLVRWVQEILESAHSGIL